MKVHGNEVQSHRSSRNPETPRTQNRFRSNLKQSLGDFLVRSATDENHSQPNDRSCEKRRKYDLIDDQLPQCSDWQLSKLSVEYEKYRGYPECSDYCHCKHCRLNAKICDVIYESEAFSNVIALTFNQIKPCPSEKLARGYTTALYQCRLSRIHPPRIFYHQALVFPKPAAAFIFIAIIPCP